MNSKLIKLVFGVCAASTVLAGCGDADSHPSQMVKMRSQMQQQRDAMKSGMTNAPAPGNSGGAGAGNSTGQ